MFLAIAVETNPTNLNTADYKIWYLEMGPTGEVFGIGVKSKEQLLESIFENMHKFGKSNWRCFQKDQERSTEIELHDFLAMSKFENTHFGLLPTLSEFQTTIDSLQMNLELRSIA